MSYPKRRFLDGSAASPTFIGASSVFEGNIRGVGQFVVSGEVHGDGDIQGGLNVCAGGRWHGHIRARQAIIGGEIVGSLTIEGKLEIGHRAVIRGNVSARTIAIAGGAIVDGDIEVTSDAPLLRFDERREVLD